MHKGSPTLVFKYAIYIVTVSMSCIDGPAENMGIEIDLLVCYLATTVGSKIKFTFRFCTTVVLRYEPRSKKQCEIFTTEA